MFKFSLEAVLKQRRIREEQAARLLVEASRALAESRRALEGLRQALLEVEEDNRGRLEKGVPIAEMELCRLREVNLLQDIEKARQTVKERSRAREEAERQLLNCVKDRRLLERVRERHYEAYKEELERSERLVLDEVAIIKAARSLS
jgi:flagellar FliJ protein